MLARSESSTMSTLWMSPHDLNDVPPPNPALLWRQQTEGSIEALPPAPTALHVRCAPPYGTLTFSGLEEDTTVGWLKEQLAERLELPPSKKVHLSHWGAELTDDWKTLQDLRLREGSQVSMRTSLCDPGLRPLERVRVTCTALQTRSVVVDAKATTGLELKRSIQAQLMTGERAFYDKAGVRTVVTGTTVLCAVAQAADEKTETPELRLGEEFISTLPILGEAKGKGVSVMRVQKGGDPFTINDNMFSTLLLPPEKQRLSFRGVDVPDDALLWELGVRQDDPIQLEFESPLMPAVLQLLRAPEKPKAAKKGGKGGKKKK